MSAMETTHNDGHSGERVRWWRRKPKRFVAQNIGGGRFRVIIPWAVHLADGSPIPRDIVRAHPELRLDYAQGEGAAKRAARTLNRLYPTDLSGR